MEAEGGGWDEGEAEVLGLEEYGGEDFLDRRRSLRGFGS